MVGVILNATSMTGIVHILFLELVLALAAEKTMEIVVTLDLSVRAASWKVTGLALSASMDILSYQILKIVPRLNKLSPATFMFSITITIRMSSIENVLPDVKSAISITPASSAGA
jgi:hypothetical protein